jgi:hypothetical protein
MSVKDTEGALLVFLLGDYNENKLTCEVDYFAHDI